MFYPPEIVQDPKQTSPTRRKIIAPSPVKQPFTKNPPFKQTITMQRIREAPKTLPTEMPMEWDNYEIKASQITE